MYCPHIHNSHITHSLSFFVWVFFRPTLNPHLYIQCITCILWGVHVSLKDIWLFMDTCWLLQSDLMNFQLQDDGCKHLDILPPIIITSKWRFNNRKGGQRTHDLQNMLQRAMLDQVKLVLIFYVNLPHAVVLVFWI